MEIDKATGLPKVPKGYFWSVRSVFPAWMGFAEIQLRKKFRWFGSWAVATKTRYDFQINENEIRDFTRILWHENFGPSGKITRPSPRRFYGDYPPKSLKDN